LSRFIKLALDKQYDALSSLWLEELENGIPTDIVISVIEVLSGNNEHALAGELVELTVGEIKNKDISEIPMLIKGIAGFFHKQEFIRRILVETLRDEYLLFRPLEYFLARCGLTARGADIAVCQESFLSLMHYSVGNYIYHNTYGAGQISSVSRVFITIDFQENPGHDMRLSNAVESTLPLSADSLLVLRDSDPVELNRLLKDNPQEFLSLMMNEPIVENSTAVRRHLAVILGVPERGITKSWNTLKGLASRNPDLSVLGDDIVITGRETSLVEQIKNLIYENSSDMSLVVKKISPLLKTASSDDRESLFLLLPDLISLKSPETGAVFELCWFLSNRGFDASFDEARKVLLEPTASRALRALGEIHSMTCSKKYISLYLSSSAPGDEILKFFSSLQKSLWVYAANLLIDTNIEIVKACIHLFLSNPADTDRYLRTMLFIAGHSTEELMETERNIISLLMENITFAGADIQKKTMRYLLDKRAVEFDAWIARQDTRKLENLLLVLEKSTAAQKEGFFLKIKRAVSERKTSTARMDISKAHFWESDFLFSSSAAIEKRGENIIHLKDVEIPKAIEAISVAASHGDLKENAEYHAAIERRDLLLDRMKTWNDELKIYYPYPKEKINDRIVSPGTSVTMENADGSNVTIDLVGPLDADSDKGKINYKAPIGQLLLGKGVGDSVVLPKNESTESIIIFIKVLNFPEKQ